MSLVANWRQLLKRAWSLRFIALTFALIAIDVALPAFEDALGLPARTFAVLSGLCSAAAFVARLLPQPSISGDEQ
ncbi:hypothetical protein [Aureimonas phyllosphaerae]|uniref:Uncharacterized protein n=1 Tax=Aureimonas phyllosphaerae TaxID=1166078 RepID=A0A7W6BWC4_9HYPH|nr:hypothetical protein [Aureimonas phyllosphaerae]MBB3935905.1 hypothetical protein [Aureimonas phyllosphaerae]MBB3959913.1 hypothetical protein [Aureimonas phyllosphaerae]SFF56862.1 hypothetical protein SAMN05216566_1316 [Aureimonas phyllosphaerae]